MPTHLIRRWRPLLGTALVAFATGPALRAQTPEEIFSGANAAYEQGRYDDAAQGYRMLIKYQIRDPRVEYNLGNTEFRSGRLGKAILHFERARRLDPTDHDIRANLAYARSFCFDQVPVSDAPALLLWLRAGQDRLGPDRQAWIFLGLFWALCMIIAWTSNANSTLRHRKPLYDSRTILKSMNNRGKTVACIRSGQEFTDGTD